MSPKLKPLLLPQLVEERRKQEVQQQKGPDGDVTYVFYIDNGSSSSDIGSPVTPTFSQRGHLRYSSSTSSLELLPPSSSCSDSPASPTQPAHAAKTTKRPLPDVQEEPLEREEDELSAFSGLYDCLCDEPCMHHGVDAMNRTAYSPTPLDFDYDLGFLSDSDFSTSPRSPKKRRGGSDSPLSGLTSRLGSRIPRLSRWRSSGKRTNLTFTPASETALDQRPSLSRGPSSRSSSLSGPSRSVFERSNEPPLPPPPDFSLYESHDSVGAPMTLELDQASVRKSLERERAMATTPLLPPLMTDPLPPSQVQSAQPSPLQSPTIAPTSHSAEHTPPPPFFPSPPLSTKLSISSFRPPVGSSFSAPPTACPSEIPSPIPNFNLLDQGDIWADRLGHANFTIQPLPYSPDDASLESLRELRTQWDQARINYTKHLVRTGEHYGTTSNIYSLTEAKWAEIEHEWKTSHDAVVDRIVGACGDDEIDGLHWQRLQDNVPGSVQKMLDPKKFPERGDEDIVGPMLRDTFMARDVLGGEDKHGASKFWKNLKVKLRK